MNNKRLQINDFTNMILNSMKVFEGLFDHDLAIKVVYLNANGVTTFQCIKTRIVT
jgi:hypothetical protein